MDGLGILGIIIAIISAGLFLGGLWADGYDRRAARRRSKDGPRWHR